MIADGFLRMNAFEDYYMPILSALTATLMLYLDLKLTIRIFAKHYGHLQAILSILLM
jgi:hypothetical protein